MNEARIWARVEKTDGCWNWTGSLNDQGYGQIRVGPRPGRLWRAHRLVWTLLRGELPDLRDAELDHLCRNRRCVNPDHLELVTHQENLLRGNSPVAMNARKDNCKRGHPLSGSNVYVRKDTGHRQCKTCRNEWMRGKRVAA